MDNNEQSIYHATSNCLYSFKKQLGVSMNSKYMDIISKEISSGVSLLDLLTYNGSCYWWLIDLLIYQSISRKKILFANSSFLRKMMFISFNLTPGLLFVYDSLTYIMWRFLSSTHNTQHSELKLPTLLYRMGFGEWRTLNQQKKSNIMHNIYHESIVKKMNIMYDNCVDIQSVYELPTLAEISINNILRYMHIMKHGELNGSRQTLLIEYWSPKVWVQEVKAFYHFKKVAKIITENKAWVKEFANICDMDITTVNNLFDVTLKYALPIVTRNMSMYENLIESNDTRGYVLQDEQSPSGRIIQRACKKHDVVTIAIQHGGIAKHSGYLFHPVNKENSSDKAFPIPTVTCVWGMGESKLLINVAGYPANSVAITGNQRYDSLCDIAKRHSRDEFCKRYNIDKNTKILLWATQNHGFPINDVVVYFNEIFTELDKIFEFNVTLIIKQHPYEGDEYRKLINQYIINKPGRKFKIIVPNKLDNTTEMVYASDAIILHSSTVGQEAISFHKPLIILDFSENPDYAEYVKEGVGIPAFKKGHLHTIIEDVFNNKYSLTDAQNRYISEHMHKIDGGAAERIVQVIHEHIKTSSL